MGLTIKNEKQYYKLSILITQDGLSFCTQNTENNTLDVFFNKSFHENLDPEKILVELQSAIKFNIDSSILTAITKVKVVYANNLYNIVPQKYFSEDKLTDYLKFNTKILHTDFIAFDELKNISANSVYIPYTNINNYLFDQFGEFTYTHSSTLLVDLCLLNASSKQNTELVYLNIYASTFDICIIKDNKLLLANSFEYFTPQDFIYYVLFCLEQLKLNNEELQMYLCGKISETDDLYHYLYTYVKNIEFLDTSFLVNQFKNLSEKGINPKQNLLLLSNLL